MGTRGQKGSSLSGANIAISMGVAANACKQTAVDPVNELNVLAIIILTVRFFSKL